MVKIPAAIEFHTLLIFPEFPLILNIPSHCDPSKKKKKKLCELKLTH